MSVTLPIAAALAAAAIGIATPAAAIDLSHVVELCRKTGACVLRPGRGGWNIKYGHNEIYCPDKGECAPRRTGGGGGLGGIKWGTNPGRILTWPPRSDSIPKLKTTPRPKTPPTAEPTATPSVPIQRNKTVRDHRGSNDGGGTTVTTTRPLYDGAERATGSGPSKERLPDMRDHRATGSDSSKGPSASRKPDLRDHRTP